MLIVVDAQLFFLSFFVCFYFYPWWRLHVHVSGQIGFLPCPAITFAREAEMTLASLEQLLHSS